MSAYIKTSTSEYPRHAGDIAIDPAGHEDYALVTWTDPPLFDRVTERCGETAPALIDGQWTMQWAVRAATPEEIEAANRPPRMPFHELIQRRRKPVGKDEGKEGDEPTS
jgi:hypothetical protein